MQVFHCYTFSFKLRLTHKLNDKDLCDIQAYLYLQYQTQLCEIFWEAFEWQKK